MKRVQKIFWSVTLTFFVAFGSPARATNDIYVIHFVLDGLRPDILNQNVALGNVPNLENYFVKNGAVFENALTTFPTVSHPAYTSFTTGLSSGNSGIFFLEWFDRTERKPIGYLTLPNYLKVNDDMISRPALRNAKEPRMNPPATLFEKLSPLPTASLYAPFRKGATFALPKKFPTKSLWKGLVTKDGLAFNKLAMQDLQKLFASPSAKIPRYTLVALYGPDFYGHKAGPESEEIQWDLKLFDELFKQFTAQLESVGLKDKTYLILSSDHGMHATGRLFNLRKRLAQKKMLDSKKIYVGNRGVASTFIYVAGANGWEQLPSIYDFQNFKIKNGDGVDLIQTLLDEEAIGWLAARDTLDRVKIFDAKGEGLLLQMMVHGETFYSYQFRGADPLGFSEIPASATLMDGKPHSAEKWFEATASSNYPNAIIQLSNLFKDPRAGDLLVVAKDAYNFRTLKAGSHGALSRADMHIPLWISGPGIPKGRFANARGVDLYPTVMGWFGLSEKVSDQDGRPLFAAPAVAPKDAANETLMLMEKELMEVPNYSKSIDKQVVANRLNDIVSPSLRPQLLQRCNEELGRRHEQWKKLHTLQQNEKGPKKIRWLLSNELNFEFLRLRRMEAIRSILNNP